MSWLQAVLTGFIEGCAIGAIRVVLTVNCVGLIVYVSMVAYQYVQWRMNEKFKARIAAVRASSPDTETK